MAKQRQRGMAAYVAYGESISSISSSTAKSSGSKEIMAAAATYSSVYIAIVDNVTIAIAGGNAINIIN